MRGCEARSGNSCLAPLVRGCEGARVRGSLGELLPRTPGARVRGCEARSGNSCLAPLVRGCEGEPRTPAPGVPSRCNGTDCDGANFQNQCTVPVQMYCEKSCLESSCATIKETLSESFGNWSGYLWANFHMETLRNFFQNQSGICLDFLYEILKESLAK